MRSLDLDLDLVLNQVEGTSSRDMMLQEARAGQGRGAPGVINELIGPSTALLSLYTCFYLSGRARHDVSWLSHHVLARTSSCQSTSPQRTRAITVQFRM